MFSTRLGCKFIAAKTKKYNPIKWFLHVKTNQYWLFWRVELIVHQEVNLCSQFRCSWNIQPVQRQRRGFIMSEVVYTCHNKCERASHMKNANAWLKWRLSAYILLLITVLSYINHHLGNRRWHVAFASKASSCVLDCIWLFWKSFNQEEIEIPYQFNDHTLINIWTISHSYLHVDIFSTVLDAR